MAQTLFATKVRTAAGKAAARQLIDSLRTFGGEMQAAPFWLFAVDPQSEPCTELESETVRVIPLNVPPDLQDYDFGDKVFACAWTEDCIPSGVQSLVWIDPSCLVVNPPVLYALNSEFDAAVRPVHIRNVGLRAGEPLDAFWARVYAAAGGERTHNSVESFVDRQVIRPYFNTHSFSINPQKGTLHHWLIRFTELVRDGEFQAGACRDELHRIFLHQAVFSALLAASIPPERLRILPAGYNYPYHLQPSIPVERRARALNDLVTFAFEDQSIQPEDITGIEVNEPLRSWLAGHA